ncbi:hypothetical protein Ddye_026295 [Dipteronia dyeriana]|uniref:RNase H type-1 domain-containing protein n=1 Tax=Dipteronia dyeriana TaxID=168575 RepID=A0AAD9TN10_9ROSI|nr:hypothetical protein Ddye_026295 [Dipteronia dyeriana]
MNECLDIFCDLSRQQVSYPKSRIFFSNNVKKSDAWLIARTCDSLLTNDLGRYLGIPLNHGRISSKTYKEIVEKTQKRLATWKSDSLSLAGRATLIKVMTSAILFYAMQFVKLPSEICNKLDKINRDFLYGHTSLRVLFILLIGTQFLYLKEMVALESRSLSHKYLNNILFTDPNLNKNKVRSSTWKSISFGVKLISIGLKWRVGSGTHIRFWVDEWVPDIAILTDHAIVRIGNDDLKLTVDSFKTNGEWHLPQLAIVLPWNIVHRINSIHAGKLHSGPDKTLLHEKIRTNLQRYVCGITVDPSCPKCNTGIESIDHLLRGCRESVVVLEIFFKGSTSSADFKGDLEGWLASNLQSGKLTIDNLPNYLHFSSIITASGVLCDYWKNWLKRFVLNKGIGSVIKVELWGLYEGLKMAWNSSFRKVTVETESLTSVHLIHYDIKHHHPLYSLIKSCKSLVADDWNCSITLIFKEGNKLADRT